MKFFSITILFTLIFLSNFGFSQKFIYNKVNKELLQLSKHDIDVEANAAITYKSGNRSIEFSEMTGFRANFSQKTQIKIFESDAKGMGTFSFYYYSPASGGNRVKIFGLKGATYNLKDEKIIVTKINDENVFYEQHNNYFKKATITMPMLQKGSVFEYEYTLSSEYISNIDDFDIQEDYPVIYNELHLEYPDIFKYQINVLGGISPISDIQNSINKSMSLKYSNGDPGTPGRQTQYIQQNMLFITRKLIFENIPAFVSEPFVANKEDGKGIVTHQLIGFQTSYMGIKNFAQSYEMINTELMLDDDFGRVLKKGDFISDLIDLKSETVPIKIAQSIYNYFVENTSCTMSYNKYANLSGKQLFKEGKGGVGDINLNYIAALNHAGIKTVPILLSTRGHGTLHPIYPNYSKMNYVVAMSYINDKPVFSDASSILPFGFLPIHCLNGKGWTVVDVNPEWVSMKVNNVGKQITLTEISVADNRINYNTSTDRLNYFAFKDMEDLDHEKESFLNNFSKENELILDSVSISEKKDLRLRIIDTQHRMAENESHTYIKPFIHLPFKEFPFTKENRISPIDFPYSHEYKFVSTISIDDGYNIEVPQNIIATLGDNEVSIKYLAVVNKDIKKVNIVADFKINKTSFLPDEYVDFKESVKAILNKLNEPVVLIKL